MVFYTVFASLIFLNDLLKLNDDTTLMNTLEDYLRIIKDEGFEIVSKIDFINDYESHDKESLFIAWHKDGILLVFDTYRGKDINGGHFYYNWKPNPDEKEWFYYTSSGCFNKDLKTYIGSHDAREALRFHINQLREHGTFLSQWIERPFIWLLHFMDTRGDKYDYPAINEARISVLPDHVKKAITPKGT